MRTQDLPYSSIQMLTHVNYLVYGDRNVPKNPCRWHAVCLNLPESEGYNPLLSQVSKVCLYKLVACEVYIYVDDGQITGPTKLERWAATRRLCSVTSSLRIQDAFLENDGRRLKAMFESLWTWWKDTILRGTG